MNTPNPQTLQTGQPHAPTTLKNLSLSLSFKLSKDGLKESTQDPSFRVQLTNSKNDDSDLNEERYKTLLTQKWKQFDRDQEQNRNARVTFSHLFRHLHIPKRFMSFDLPIVSFF